MELYLIRHGETDASYPEHYSSDKGAMDPPLTPQGEAQAERLAKRLGAIDFDHIYCSDLQRAVQTATIVNRGRGITMTALEAFREIHMGEMEQKSWEDYPQEYARWSTHKEDTPYPNGENGEAVWTRCRGALQAILQRDYERVMIVCHGGTIRSIVSGVLELPQQRRFYLGVPPHNCSISMLVYRGELYVHSFNDYAHLI